jgi:hypothetical protein
VRGIGLHGFEQVGDEIESALQLHINLGPGVFYPVAQLHQVVEHDNSDDDEQYD